MERMNIRSFRTKFGTAEGMIEVLRGTETIGWYIPVGSTITLWEQQQMGLGVRAVNMAPMVEVPNTKDWPTHESVQNPASPDTTNEPVGEVKELTVKQKRAQQHAILQKIAKQ